MQINFITLDEKTIFFFFTIHRKDENDRSLNGRRLWTYGHMDIYPYKCTEFFR